jgi:gluconolactonase
MFVRFTPPTLTMLLASGALLLATQLRPICEAAEPVAITPRPTGKIERLDPRLDAIVAADARVEQVAEGLMWTEGPVWFRDGNFLLFSDIPRNSVYKWSEADGLELFLKPSGYTGDVPRGGESGSNGLAIDADGRLVLCQHGDRRIARVDAPLSARSANETHEAKFATVADKWEGKRFNSPNDLVIHSNGAIYFTDPPYGLLKGGDLSTQEIDFNGVYRVSPAGDVMLATREMTKPNGLALSPDEKTLYVGQSDSDAPLWRAFDIHADGSLGKGRVVFNAKKLAEAGRKGSPDGIKVDANGNLLATGPGGVLVLTPEGEHLGTIMTGDVVSNCAFGDDGSTLYMTSNHAVCRVKLKTKGAGY